MFRFPADVCVSCYATKRACDVNRFSHMLCDACDAEYVASRRDDRFKRAALRRWLHHEFTPHPWRGPRTFEEVVHLLVSRMSEEDAAAYAARKRPIVRFV